MKKLSVGQAKKILNTKEELSSSVLDWIVRWTDQLCKENSYPPQLIGGDFLPNLSYYFTPTQVLDILARIRADFIRSFPKEASPDPQLISDLETLHS